MGILFPRKTDLWKSSTLDSIGDYQDPKTISFASTDKATAF
jgi:hypothetical protein